MTTDLPAPRQSIGHHAAEYVRTLIVTGVLGPDTRIPQDEIAETLQISRIPLREGLQELEREGLVRIELNRGAFVNRFDADAVMDHYELYGLTYGLAVRRAIARSDESLVAILADLHRTLKGTDDPDRFRQLVLSFHSSVLEAARSPRITASVHQAPRLVPGNFFAEVDGATESERRGLAAILRAVKQADADTAATAYLTMMRKQGRLAVAYLTSRGMFVG